MNAREHARLAPSAAPRWVHCPGSVVLCEQYPEREDSPHALEGTAAHWVAEVLLRHGTLPGEGTLAPNGVAVTQEMMEGAELYADTIAGRARHVEKRVNCPAIHPDCWGTPDNWAAVDDVVYIDDYKFGHRLVDPYRNWQLATYAAGICPDMPADTVVVFTVVQPRGYHRDGPVREWRTTVRELAEYWFELYEAAAEALGPDPLRTTGGHCRDCSARHACPELQAAGLSWAEESGRGLPLDLPPAALGLELHIAQAAIARLEARASGLEEQAMAMARDGLIVPGYRLEPTAGRERWARPVEEVVTFGDLFGVDLRKPGALTPKQAVKAGLPRDVVSQYSETPAGGLKLVPDDGTMAARVFGGAP